MFWNLLCTQELGLNLVRRCQGPQADTHGNALCYPSAGFVLSLPKTAPATRWPPARRSTRPYTHGSRTQLVENAQPGQVSHPLRITSAYSSRGWGGGGREKYYEWAFELWSDTNPLSPGFLLRHPQIWDKKGTLLWLPLFLWCDCWSNQRDKNRKPDRHWQRKSKQTRPVWKSEFLQFSVASPGARTLKVNSWIGRVCWVRLFPRRKCLNLVNWLKQVN